MHPRCEQLASAAFMSDASETTANLRTETLDFGGFDSSIILILRGRILMSTGIFPESSSQRILVGIISIWRLGVNEQFPDHPNP